MRITILSQVDPTAIGELEAAHKVTVACGTRQADVPAAVEAADVVVMRSGVELDRSVLAQAPNLKLIVRAGSGYDNIDVEAAGERGVMVVRIPGPSSRAVAELTLGLMLAASRNIVEADASMRKGQWRKAELGGNLLRSKVAGVVGLGNIGSVVADLCRAMGMTVVGCVSEMTDVSVRRFAGSDIEILPLEDVAATADYLTLHVPLDDTTRHIVDADLLERMNDGSYLVNTSRGGVVDEAALAKALDAAGGVQGAALDTHELEGGGLSPLADHPKVVLTPHIGSMAVEAQAEIGKRLVELVEAFDRAEIEGLLTEHERVA